ncbi:MAG: alpha-galactosidase, partial [Clostridia bacterium]|nr:alpha-galactosidase [Clostridia bacterium]
GELTKSDACTLKLLTNEGILGMHSNSRHAHPLWRRGIGGTEHILWTAQDAEGGDYLAVFNVGDGDSEITISLADAEIFTPVSMTEFWSGQKTDADGSFTVKLSKHGAKAFKITAK